MLADYKRDFYGLLCTTLGATLREVNEMEMEGAEMLMEYWADHPPVHLLVAAYMGVKPRSATPADLSEIAGMRGGW